MTNATTRDFRRHPHCAGSRKRRGFATIMAIALVGLVGFTLAALAAGLTRDARRASTEATDAQLRQLVHAGSAEARDLLRRGEAKPGDIKTIALPADLSLMAAKVEVRFTAAEGNVVADIVASMGRREMSQRVLNAP